MAALAFRVSKIVSIRNISTSQSARVSACSLYVATNSSNVTSLYAGFITSGEIDAVLFVGPIEAATNLGFSGVEYSSATSFAIFTDWTFNSLT